MKLTVSTKKQTTKGDYIGKIVRGEESLQVSPGTILRVMESSSNNGDIILKTNSRYEHPFVTISNGEVWGVIIQDYVFEILSLSNTEVELVIGCK